MTAIPRAHFWVLFPLLAVLSWTTTLVGLLACWLGADDAGRLLPDQASVAYISDVGDAASLCFRLTK